jgi:hypothetical protein
VPARANGDGGRAARSGTRQRVPSLDSGADIRELGEALRRRAAEVLERTITRASDSGTVSEGVVRDSFEGIGTLATNALAEWMTTGSVDASVQAGSDGWQLFGKLAAQRATPLHEVTRRCLYWRDAAGDVLRDAA